MKKIYLIVLSAFLVLKGYNQNSCDLSEEGNCKNKDCQSYYLPDNCKCPITNNSSKNCCCGREYYFYTYPYANKHIIGLIGSKDGNSHFCQLEDANGNPNYDFLHVNSWSAIGGDWMLIWYDEFDYGVLNKSFYNYLLIEQSYESTNIVYDDSQVELSGGKLKLKSKYDPNPNSVYSYWGPMITGSGQVSSNECYPCTPRHFDYVLGRIHTDFKFSGNYYDGDDTHSGVRIQAKIRLHPNTNYIGTNFWLNGPWSNNYQEVDIFETGKSYSPLDPLTDNPYNICHSNYNLSMTYHSTKYQAGGTYTNGKRSEGVFRYTGVPLDQTFNQYDLIWDYYKLEWWFNGVILWKPYRHYNMEGNWGQIARLRNFRRYGINGYSSNNPTKVSYNTYFPSIQFPFLIKFDITSLKSNGDYRDVNPSTDVITPSAVGGTAEMDYLKIWLRADCNKNNVVYQNDFLYTSSYEQYIIETGKTITTNPGSNIHISAPVWWGMGSAIYAATEEIAFNDGFEVDETGNLFAFITTCENAWDTRVMNTDTIKIVREDDEIGEYITKENEHGESKADIYPNPASHHFHIFCNEEDWYDLSKIELVNVLGQVVELPKERIQDVSGYTEGMYYVKFYFTSGVIVVKPLMIKKE